ncbi:MAG: septum formation initiator family protein [Desulforhopalus sp.]|nr:septum formation initiator family protein [Desulforhopalus sp.]
MKRMRPKPRPSPLQKERLVRLFGALLIVILAWLFFAPGAGILAWWSKRSELSTLEGETSQLEAANTLLQEDIDRLADDPAYLEELARKEHNLLRKNEQVFDFSRGGSEQQDE